MAKAKIQKSLELAPEMVNLPIVNFEKFVEHLKETADQHCTYNEKEMHLINLKRIMVKQTEKKLHDYIVFLKKDVTSDREKDSLHEKTTQAFSREYEFYDALKEFIEKYSLAKFLKFKIQFSMVEKPKV